MVPPFHLDISLASQYLISNDCQYSFLVCRSWPAHEVECVKVMRADRIGVAYYIATLQCACITASVFRICYIPKTHAPSCASILISIWMRCLPPPVTIRHETWITSLHCADFFHSCINLSLPKAVSFMATAYVLSFFTWAIAWYLLYRSFRLLFQTASLSFKTSCRKKNLSLSSITSPHCPRLVLCLYCLVPTCCLDVLCRALWDC